RECARPGQGGRRLRLSARGRGGCRPSSRGVPRLPRMIDLRAARNDPDGFRAALARKGAAELFDQLLEADRSVREVQPRVEELRAAQNAFTRSLRGKPSQEDLNRLAGLKEDLREEEERFKQLEGRRQELLDRIPNPPSDETPDGETEEDAVEIRRVGEPPSFGFP